MELNREKERAYKRAWNAKNPDKVKGYAKKYYEQMKGNPDFDAKRKDYHAEWQKKNKDKWNAYLRERRKKQKRDCTDCKHFVGCERVCHGICDSYEVAR